MESRKILCYSIKCKKKERGIGSFLCNEVSTNMQSKYKAIYQQYVDMIESGELSPGDSLPSEGKMTETFETSRDTIRKAMTLLEQNNYILKSRGKESVVLEQLQEEKENAEAQMVSYIEFPNCENETDVKKEKLVEDISILVDNERMMKEFKINDTQEVYRIERIEKLNGKKIILKKDYYLKGIVSKLTEEICKGSIREHLEKEGIQPKVIKRKITISELTKEDQILLDTGEDKEIVLLQSYYYLEDGSLFHYSETRCLLSYFQFVEYIQK